MLTMISVIWSESLTIDFKNSVETTHDKRYGDNSESTIKNLSFKKFSPELDTNTKHFLPFHPQKFQWESRYEKKKKKGVKVKPAPG